MNVDNVNTGAQRFNVQNHFTFRFDFSFKDLGALYVCNRDYSLVYWPFKMNDKMVPHRIGIDQAHFIVCRVIHPGKQAGIVLKQIF
jgi:hypothetical protein